MYIEHRFYVHTDARLAERTYKALNCTDICKQRNVIKFDATMSQKHNGNITLTNKLGKIFNCNL